MIAQRIGVAGLAFPAGTPLEIQAAEARRHGFDRIDPLARPGEADDAAAVRRALGAASVRAGCLYGYPGDGPDHLRRLIALAADIGADAVRVLPGRMPVAACTGLLAAALTEEGPPLALQNHPGSSLDLADALAVVRAVDHPRLRLACSPDHAVAAGVWDAAVLAAVAPWTSVWLWSDVVRDAAGTWHPCLPGTGAVPWAGIRAVVAADPAAIVSCKWERRWHPQLPDTATALPAYRAHLTRA